MSELLSKYEELLSLVSEQRKRVCEANLEKFIRTYLPHFCTSKTPEFHKEIYGMLTDAIRGKKERVLIVAPRGFAKSTITTVFSSLWMALYAKKKDILIVSATGKLAIEQMRKIRVELENNEKIFEDFGEQKSDKWTEDHLILKNGTNIRAKGRGFQVRGFRPDIIICDDLEDEEVIYSKDQRDKTQYWFLRTLMPTLHRGNPLVYIGTKLHQFSLIAKLEEKPEFYSKKYQALTKGVSIWEDLWPADKLEQLRTELGSYAFEAEYQNNPISLEEQPIKFEHIDGVIAEGEIINKALAFDPAISEKETSDYRAIVVFGQTDKGMFKELHAERGKWGVHEQVDKVIELYRVYEPERVIVEEVAYQRVFRDLLTRKGREQGVYIPVTSAELSASPKDSSKRPKDKLTRLLSVVHLFEQRLVQIKNRDLFDEALAFPFGDYDDMVDAMVYALYFLMKYQKGGFISKKETLKSPLKEKDSFVVEEERPGVYVAHFKEPKMVTDTGNFKNYDR